MHRKVPAGFGGRLHGKGPHQRDLAVQPTLLQERDSRLARAGPEQNGPDGDGGQGPGGNGGRGPQPGGNGAPGSGPQAGPARHAGPDQGPSVAALINITVPLDTATGQSATPGEAAGYGPLDPDDARALLAAAARHPDTRWCVTALHPDGTAAAHGCARGRHPPPPAPTPDRPIDTTGPAGDPPDPDPPPGATADRGPPGPDHPTWCGGWGHPPGPDPPPEAAATWTTLWPGTTAG